MIRVIVCIIFVLLIMFKIIYANSLNIIDKITYNKMMTLNNFDIFKIL